MDNETNGSRTPSPSSQQSPLSPQGSNSKKGFLIGNLCILVATIFWGVNVSVTKALIPEWMSAYGIIVVRLVGGCVLMWIASLFIHCAKIQ